MCSIQGDGGLRGLAPTNKLSLFLYDVALCLPGAILRGLVASIFAPFIFQPCCELYVFVYLFIFLVYSFVADEVRRHLGFLIFVADDLPQYLCNVLVVFILLGSYQPKI